MTSAVEGGSPKSRQKEQNQLIFDSDRGEGVQKSETFADVIYGSPLRLVASPILNYGSKPPRYFAPAEASLS